MDEDMLRHVDFRDTEMATQQSLERPVDQGWGTYSK